MDHGVVQAAGAWMPLIHHLSHASAPHLDERELGSDEEAVGKNEGENCEQAKAGLKQRGSTSPGAGRRRSRGTVLP